MLFRSDQKKAESAADGGQTPEGENRGVQDSVKSGEESEDASEERGEPS